MQLVLRFTGTIDGIDTGAGVALSGFTVKPGFELSETADVGTETITWTITKGGNVPSIYDQVWISYDGEAGIEIGGTPLRAFNQYGTELVAITATATTDGAAAVFDAAGTPVMIAAVQTDGAAGVFDAAGEVASGATITAVGSGLTVTGVSMPRLAVMTSSLFAYHDSNTDQLRAYSANTTTGAVALSGSGMSLSLAYSAIVGMGSDWIATHAHNGSAGSLRRHNWSGSAWSQASTTSNANLDPAIIKVNATTVVVKGGQDEGTYSWNGSNFTLLTSNVPGSGAGTRPGAYLEDGKIALFSPATVGYNLEAWSLVGTTWSKVGNTLFVAIQNELNRSSVTSLTSTRIVSYWGGATGGRKARIFDFNGTDWAQVAEQQIGSATASTGAVAALGSSHFVHVDDVLDKLQIYSVT